MREYAEERDRQAELASSSASIQRLSTSASGALGHGLGRIARNSNTFHLGNLDDDVGVTPPRRHTSDTAGSAICPPETPTRPSTLSSNSSLPLDVIARRNREMIVELEHDRYLGLPDSKKYEDLGKIDLVKYWNVSELIWTPIARPTYLFYRYNRTYPSYVLSQRMCYLHKPPPCPASVYFHPANLHALGQETRSMSIQ